jgi:hypothetical protein
MIQELGSPRINLARRRCRAISSFAPRQPDEFFNAIDP